MRNETGASDVNKSGWVYLFYVMGVDFERAFHCVQHYADYVGRMMRLMMRESPEQLTHSLIGIV